MALTIEQRNNAIETVRNLIIELYGERCEEREAGCACCCAWVAFDAIDGLTEASLIEDEVEIHVQKAK